MAKCMSQSLTDQYALYCSDCLEVMQNIQSGAVHLSLYSPPSPGFTTTVPVSAI